jgi:spore coat protein U-like protein
MKFSSVFRKSVVRAVAGSTAICALAGAADAGTATSSFTVTATVTNSCTISANGNIAGLSQLVTSASTTVSVTCNTGTPWTLGFGGGNDTAGQNSLPFHYMKNSATYVEYVLTGAGSGITFSDGQGRLANDTTSSPATFTASGTGTGAMQTATITAQATTGAGAYSINAARSGAYTDTVTITVNF